MNSSAKKWQTIGKDQGMEIGLIHITIGPHGKQGHHGLILPRAKDLLKDAIHVIAERYGGKLSSWEDDAGMFLFPIESSESFNNCCLAALEMLDKLPSVKQEVQLTPDLERLIAVRISCDAGMVAYDSKEQDFPGEFVDQFKKAIMA